MDRWVLISIWRIQDVSHNNSLIKLVRPHSWIFGLNLSWARSNLGSQFTCMVGLSFLLRVVLDRDLIRSLFSFSLLPFSSFFFPTPISSPISPTYSSKLVGGIMITAIVSAIKGLILSALGGCSGDNGKLWLWLWNLVPIWIDILGNEVQCYLFYVDV